MKYTVHRALSLIKSTKSRIAKEFSEDAPVWIRVARGQEDSIRGVSVEEIRREIQSHYDRVTALIENYIALKSAVVQSNAGVLPGTELRKVSVGGKKLTVAEIIELATRFTQSQNQICCRGRGTRLTATSVDSRKHCCRR